MSDGPVTEDGKANNDTLLNVLAAVALLLFVAAVVFWFAAIWAHGHDLPTRLFGSGLLALVVGVLIAGTAFGIYRDEREGS